MEFLVRPVDVGEILPWREVYRQEMNCQIIHDSLHGREGWTQPYLIEAGGDAAGYGSIAVGGPWTGSRTLFEFYIDPKQRSRFFEAFEALRAGSGADAIETQTNDVLLTAMLHTWGRDVVSEKIIFEDRLTTAYRVQGARLRQKEPGGEWMLLEVGGRSGCDGRHPLPLQPAVWGHLDGGWGAVSRAGIRDLPGAGTEADLPGGRQRALRPLQHGQCRFEANPAKGRICALCAPVARKAVNSAHTVGGCLRVDQLAPGRRGGAAISPIPGLILL